MKVFGKNFIALTLAAAVTLGSCKKEDGADGAIKLDCVYTSTLTLTNHNATGVDYIVESCDLEIEAPLIIEPGVTIQFATDRGMFIKSGGSINALGTASAPITFTGLSASTPSWKGISIESNNVNNRMENCRIQAAGFGDDLFVISRAGSSYSADCALSIYGRLAINNSLITNSGGHGIGIDADANVADFANNTISNSAAHPVYISAKIVGQPNLASCTFTNNTINKVAIYGYTSNSEWNGPQTLQGLAIPYLGVTNLEVYDGTITLEAGVTLEMDTDLVIAVIFDGALRSNGTASRPVTIRGVQQVAGAWAGLFYDTNSLDNVLNYTNISDGGSREYFFGLRSNIGLGYITNCQLTLNNCNSTNAQGACQVALSDDVTATLNNNSPSITNVCQ